jgi:ferric-dicitrate binding protein FerR (iron transport regulator)
MDYSNYSVEQLASDDGFIHWANRTDPESEKMWDLIVLQHPEMKLKIEQARTLVLNLRKAEHKHHSDRDVDALWLRIENDIDLSERASAVLGRKSWFLSYAVATVVSLGLLVLAGWYNLYPRDFDNAVINAGGGSVSLSDFVEEANTSGKELRVHLSDGSTVTLSDGGRLQYRKDFGDEPFREVFLTGEAFFQVARDAARPFLVHTDEVVTRVLGTSFRVRASEDNREVVVSVTTGKVSVYALGPGKPDAESQKNGVILLPNQQVTYLREQDSFGKALVAEPRILNPSIKESDFIFENTPIREVFQVLQKAYGVEIIFDEEVMSNCFITAPLGSESLFEKLKIICRTIGARYETIDARVVITSAGC